METIRIVRYDHLGLQSSDKVNTKKKMDAIDRMVKANVPGWYMKLTRYLPVLGLGVRIHPMKVPPNGEKVALFFLGKYKDEVNFKYY